MMPCVSVIIPAFNRGNVILHAINSVFAQTYSNYEVLVVDDGSVDNTRQVLDQLINEGSIKYFHQSNSGPSAARNKGITHSQGEFVAFLDSDDLWLPLKLEIQMNLLQSNSDTGLVYANTFDYWPDGYALKVRYSKKLPEGNLYRPLVYRRIHLIPSTVLVRKKLLDIVGGYDETMRRGEDRDLHRRLSRLCKIKVIQQPLAIVRRHGLSFPKDPVDLLSYEETIEFELIGINKTLQEDPCWQREEQRLRARYAYCWGRGYLNAKKYREAKEQFMKSFFLYPRNIHSLVFWFYALLHTSNNSHPSDNN